MKIGIVCPYNIFKAGGVQEHVLSQAKILIQRGHEVLIITPRPYQYHKKNAPEGMRFLGRSVRVKAPHATSADVSMSVDNDAIDELLERECVDIIHVHEPLVPVLPRQILTRAKCLRVGTFHAALPGNALGKSLASSYKAYARMILPYIDVITAVSPAAIGYIKDNLDTDQAIRYIPNGINRHLLAQKNNNISRDEHMILFVGRLEKRKGVRQLLDAYVYLKSMHPKAHLIIAGDGPLRNSIVQYIETNKIQDVRLLGFVSDAEKTRLYKKASIYTSPALYGESFGIVLIESMLYETPVVAHDNEGYASVLKETGRLSLVNCNDPIEYARRMALLMEDAALRKVWQKWSKTYIEQFDYEKIVDQYEELYRKSVDKENK